MVGAGVFLVRADWESRGQEIGKKRKCMRAFMASKGKAGADSSSGEIASTA